MASAPRLVAPPVSEPRNRLARSPRERLVRVCWSVHVPDHRGIIADTTTAGADVEWLTGSRNGAAGTLLLTFWVDRVADGATRRDVLARYVQNRALAGERRDPQPVVASFRIEKSGAGLSLDVIGETPLLRLTHLASPGTPPVAWCQSLVHHLLGLRGGQYRLGEVAVDRLALASLATDTPIACEAG